MRLEDDQGSQGLVIFFYDTIINSQSQQRIKQGHLEIMKSRMSHIIIVSRQSSLTVTLLLICALLISSLAWAQDEAASIADPGSADVSYRLGAGDKLQIDVFNQADLTGEYTLDGNGRFTMHLIGKVNAAGLTPTELEALLVSKLKPDYLVNPRISVLVQNFRPFYIIGEVKSPNSYAYVDGMTYLTAVAIAGGYTYRAKKDHVYIVRGNDPDKDEIKLDVSEKVRPGDIIRIAERMF
jgi:protein involved in polysaccharide export with SLBB domain